MDPAANVGLATLCVCAILCVGVCVAVCVVCVLYTNDMIITICTHMWFSLPYFCNEQ